MLEITDGKGSTYLTVTLVIWQQSTPTSNPVIPGFEGIVVVLALGIIIALGQLRRYRKHD
jgi:hypothetical protein